MEHRKQVNSDNVERRYATEGVEYRAASEGKPAELFGYALRFNSSYRMYDRFMGEFYEQVTRAAFEGADMTDVRVLQDHNPSLILGRTKAGTAEIGVDENGVWYRAFLPASPNGDNIRVAIERGDVDQSSWSFTLREGGDKWEKRDGKLHRTLTAIDVVYDVSPVTFPANPDTTVAKRSFDAVQAVETEEEEQQQQIAAEIGILNALYEAELIKNTL